MWGRHRRDSAWQRQPSEAGAALVEGVLDRIPLVPPWTVTEFLAWIEREYGRTVLLVPWTDEGRPNPGEPGECALLITTASSYLISYDDRTSERHQRQQIFHEIGHILCGHKGNGMLTDVTRSVSVLSSGIDPAMIEYVLHRGVFESEEERAAETVGTHLAVLSRRQNGHARFDRIASAFYEPIKR